MQTDCMSLTYMVTILKSLLFFFYIHNIVIKIEHVKLDILLPDYKSNIFLLLFEIRFSQIYNCKNVSLG